MGDPQIFQFIGDSINGAMDSYVNSTVPAVISQISALAVTMGAIYYASIGLLMALGRVDGVFSKLMVSFGKFMLIGIIALSAGHYFTWVVDTSHGLEVGLTEAFAGHVDGAQTGAASDPSSVYQVIDHNMGKGFDLGADIWEKASKLSFLTSGGTMIKLFIEGFIVFLGTLIIAVPAGAMVIVAKTILLLLLGIGPFFILMLLWPVTKSFFDRWFAEVMTAIFQVALVVACLAFAMAAFTTVVGSIDINSETESTLFSCLRLAAVTATMLAVMYTAYAKAGSLGGGIASAAITLGALAASAMVGSRAVKNAINPTSTRRDLESGMMTTGSRWDHMSAGNTIWNPRYRQHVKENLGKNWGRARGGSVQED